MIVLDLARVMNLTETSPKVRTPSGPSVGS